MKKLYYIVSKLFDPHSSLEIMTSINISIVVILHYFLFFGNVGTRLIVKIHYNFYDFSKRSLAQHVFAASVPIVKSVIQRFPNCESQLHFRGNVMFLHIYV